MKPTLPKMDLFEAQYTSTPFAAIDRPGVRTEQEMECGKHERFYATEAQMRRDPKNRGARLMVLDRSTGYWNDLTDTTEAREAIKAAKAESKKAQDVAKAAGVPWSMVESTLENAVALWAKAADACRAAGMDDDAKHCQRQARALVYG